MPELRPGAVGTAALTVAAADLATAFGSGDVAVLATPRVVALVEQAAAAAVADDLDATQTTVGARIELDHLAPTRLGGTVEATATLDDVDGRRLDFTVRVTERGGEVARGRHRRVVVDRASFGS